MIRKKEYRLYLQKNCSPAQVKDYPSHCRAVEKSFNNLEIDDIIVDYKKIFAVKDALLAHGYPVSYMSGFNEYLKFAFSTSNLGAKSLTPFRSLSLYCVSCAENVSLTTDVALVCETLEQEYASIVCFAEKLFPQLELKYIPIIISNEAPMHDGPDGGEKILGAFFASEKPYIEIYYQNADYHDAASFRKCLAHEYMHYMHHVNAGKKYDVAKEELKEALADFFGVLYSIYRGQTDDLNVAKARYNSWKKNFGTYWPYANALYFYKVHGKEMKFSSDYKQYYDYGCIGKFIQIFGSTIYPDDAYKTMTEA